jgi:signal transduction histidine kinase
MEMILDGPIPQPLNSLQRWRQLCFLTTLDGRTGNQLLTVAAELMCVGAAASACMITYHPPGERPVVVSYGTLTDYVRHELIQVESQFLPRQHVPLWHECVDTQLLTIPLTTNTTYVGALHIVAPDPSITLDDFVLAAMLLTNALTRQATIDRAQQEMRTLLDLHLALHHKVTRAPVEAATLEDALSDILQAFCEELHWDQGVIWTIDPQAVVLRYVVAWQSPGLDPRAAEVFDPQATFGPNVGLAGRAWASRTPLWVTDQLETAERLEPWNGAVTLFNSALVLPIVVGDDVLGVLGLFSQASKASDPHLLTLLCTLSDRIGQAMLWKQAEAELSELTEALRIERERLLRREVEVRMQMARDLHDGPVQQVAVAELNVQYVRRVAERAPEQLPRALDSLRDQLKRATQDLRTVLYELRPLGIEEEGLVVVLHKYIARFYDSNELLIHLDAPTTLRRLPVEVESAVFIIIQEALSNVRKHAAANDVWIRLHDDGAALAVEVRDNGRGFDVRRTQGTYTQRASFGLLNMRERAQLIGGTWGVTSHLGKGTTICIRIPFGSENIS